MYCQVDNPVVVTIEFEVNFPRSSDREPALTGTVQTWFKRGLISGAPHFV